MFTVTVLFYGVLSAGLFTASFDNKPLCDYWVSQNATVLHRAARPESFARFLITGEPDALPVCVPK